MISNKKRILAAVLLVVFNVSLYASVAKISALNGDIVIVRDGVNIDARLGMLLYKKDVVASSLSSNAQIIFSDNTIAVIGSDSSFKINDYIYNQAKKEESYIELDFFKGTFEVKSGEIGDLSKENFKLRTQSADVEIRDATVMGNQNIIACVDGLIAVSSLGRTTIVSTGEYIKTFLTKLPSKEMVLTKEVIEPLKIYIQSRQDPIKAKSEEALKRFYWGGTTKIDLTKDEVKGVLEDYVKENTHWPCGSNLFTDRDTSQLGRARNQDG